MLLCFEREMHRQPDDPRISPEGLLILPLCLDMIDKAAEYVKGRIPVGNRYQRGRFHPLPELQLSRLSEPDHRVPLLALSEKAVVWDYYFLEKDLPGGPPDLYPARIPRVRPPGDDESPFCLAMIEPDRLIERMPVGEIIILAVVEFPEIRELYLQLAQFFLPLLSLLRNVGMSLGYIDRVRIDYTLNSIVVYN